MSEAVTSIVPSREDHLNFLTAFQNGVCMHIDVEHDSKPDAVVVVHPIEKHGTDSVDQSYYINVSMSIDL